MDENRVFQPSEDDAAATSQPPVRWLNDPSPYGFSDEDGTARQVESANWRRSFRFRKPRRFVPVPTSNAVSNPVNESRGPSPNVVGASKRESMQPATKAPRSKTSSTIGIQLVASAVVAAVALYAHRAPTATWTTAVHNVLQRTYQTDDTNRVLIFVERFLKSHHITIPALASTPGAIALHDPLPGPITADYSQDHPEIWIQGHPNARVMAAGSGTVTMLQKSPSGTMIEINHGNLGVTWYLGLSLTSVHLHEYVESGQVIGRLASQPAHPILRFAMLKNGQFVDPHTVMTFSSVSMP